MRMIWSALLFIVLWLPVAAQAGICAQTLVIPEDSPLLIEYDASPTPMGQDPWMMRLRHPSDPRIVVDLGLAETIPASKLDRAYMMRLERGALVAMSDLYRKSRAKLIDSRVVSKPRVGWRVQALGDGMLQEYRSERIGEACALLVAIRMPEAYANSTLARRINTMADTTAGKMIREYGAPVTRPDRVLPTGFSAIFMGLLLPLLAAAVIRGVAWKVDAFRNVPIGLLFRLGCVVPLFIGWCAVAWSLASTIWQRGNPENIELLLLTVISLALALFWLGSQKQHIAALGAILLPQFTVHLIYWARGWHWEPQHFWWVAAASVMSAIICTAGAKHSIREARNQKAVDERILDLLARSEG
jgi:hypothetical protein